MMNNIGVGAVATNRDRKNAAVGEGIWKATQSTHPEIIACYFKLYQFVVYRWVIETTFPKGHLPFGALVDGQ